ncbi:MAG: YbjN domain-containing protein [Bacillota bacterium]|nr:YbjN domain-containing protein [Bacillota bacterium]
MKKLADHFKDYFQEVSMPVQSEEFSKDEFENFTVFNVFYELKKGMELFITWEVHENYVNIAISNFVTIDSDRLIEYLELCNEINEKSRYATFYVEGDSVKLKYTLFLLDFDNMENTTQHAIEYVTKNIVILAEQEVGNFQNL